MSSANRNGSHFMLLLSHGFFTGTAPVDAFIALREGLFIGCPALSDSLSQLSAARDRYSLYGCHDFPSVLE
jgi:hypothetical protein